MSIYQSSTKGARCRLTAIIYYLPRMVRTKNKYELEVNYIENIK